MAKLVVISEEMKGSTFELSEERISVGRVTDNDIRIDHSAVSSHHAELSRKGDDYVLRDLNSTNGTRVNGQRIVETRLYNGDVVGFAHIQCEYQSTSSNAPQPLPALKKNVDLSQSTIINKKSSHRPSNFSSASPFTRAGQKTKLKTFLQVSLLVLGFTAVALLVFVIFNLFNSN